MAHQHRLLRALSDTLDLLAISSTMLVFDTESRRIVDVNIDVSLKHGDLVRVPEEGSDLLERHALGVGKEEPYDDGADRAGNDEAEEEFPADRTEALCQCCYWQVECSIANLHKGCWCSLEPHDVHQRDHSDAHGHALCSQVSGPELRDVGELQA